MAPETQPWTRKHPQSTHFPLTIQKCRFLALGGGGGQGTLGKVVSVWDALAAGKIHEELKHTTMSSGST